MALLVAASSHGSVSAVGDDPTLDHEALRASTVLISGDPADPELAGWGSGSIVSEDGLVLTNAHVAANRAPGLAMQYPDVRYDPPSPSILYIYSVDDPSDLHSPAVPAYRAEVVAADGYLDLAVLRIVESADGVRMDPTDLDLTPVPLGSSEQLELLDRLVVAGFPRIAETFAVRLTEGQLNNFSADPPVGRGAWLHTDAKIAGGNSGGPVVDTFGRQVAVATQSTSDGPGGALDFKMRPIDLAIPLIEAATARLEYDQFQYIDVSVGSESATVVGWESAPRDECVSGSSSLPIGTSLAYPQLAFDSMRSGSAVLVELRSLGGAAESVVGYSHFNWPESWGSAACVPFLELLFDRAFPHGDFTPLPEGRYGARVWTGSSLEQEISGDPYRTAVTVGRPSTLRPSDRSGSSEAEALRPVSKARRVARQLLDETLRAGFECKRYRDAGTYDPFTFARPALAAVLCEKPAGRVSQLALYRFPSAAALNGYWDYRIGHVSGRMPTSQTSCWHGERGIAKWEYGLVACFVSKSTGGKRAARIRWTDDRTLTYGIVDATNANLSVLFEWWRTHNP